MTVTVSTLGNGLRVVTHPMPHLETTSLGVWVGAGSRHECEAVHGVSHFLEHMAFKGTATRSARDIAEEIEAVGGELNAATGVEMTAYFARVLGGDEACALGLIADIVQNSSFAVDEVEKEREVILQEIAALKDSPDDTVYDLVHEAAYPGQSAGRPIIGTPASVKRLKSEDLRTFLSTNYQSGNMVVAAAGAVHHGTLTRHVEALFGGLTDTGITDAPAARYAGGRRASPKPFEQCHMMLAFEGPSVRDDDYLTAQVFSGLFGGGMSSRLFQEVRERRGLCYSIYSSAWGLRDTGMFAVHAATGTGMMPALIDVVGAEFVRAAGQVPSEAEVARAKAQLKAGLLMNLESSAARAEQLGRQLLIHDRIIDTNELIAKVDAVTATSIRDFAAGLISGRPTCAVAGAGRRAEGLARRAEHAVAG